MSYDSTSSLCGHMTNHACAKQLPVPSTGCWIIMLITTHVGRPVEHWIFNIKTCPDNPVHPNYCNFVPKCLSSVAGSHAFFGSIFCYSKCFPMPYLLFAFLRLDFLGSFFARGEGLFSDAVSSSSGQGTRLSLSTWPFVPESGVRLPCPSPLT